LRPSLVVSLGGLSLVMKMIEMMKIVVVLIAIWKCFN